MVMYHDPRHPDEGRLIMIADQAVVVATIDRLEKSGFVVDKIAISSRAKSMQSDAS